MATKLQHGRWRRKTTSNVTCCLQAQTYMPSKEFEPLTNNGFYPIVVEA
jgi:hypothetical protein